MTTNAEIRKNLLKIHTNFFEREDEPTFLNEIKMDSFSSFMVYKNPLPSNETIRNDFKDELKPEVKKGESKFLQTNLKNKYNFDLNFDDDFFGKYGDETFNNDLMFVATNVAARPGNHTISNWKNFHNQGDKMDQNILKMNLELNDPAFKGSYMTDAIKHVVDSNSSNVDHDFFATIKNSELSFANNKNEDENDLLRAKQYITFDKKDEEATAKKAAKDDKPNKFVRRFNSVDEALREVKKNRVIFYKSASLFVQEWLTIQPNHIVTFGGVSTGLLKRMCETDVFKQYPELCAMVDNAIQIHHYSYRKNLKDFYNDYSEELSLQLKK